MMREAEKTKLYLIEKYGQEYFDELFAGDGIDIGCGDSPITPDCDTFDKKDGDANVIDRFISKRYDWVFSSHCLEHMINPYRTIQAWFRLVKDGGMLIIAVPDEDLYEQGVFPSRYNGDHKWTFTVDKVDSWCNKSINVEDLLALLIPTDYTIELQDAGYDYNLKNVDQTKGKAMAQILIMVEK